jgi:hypothetical protein
MAATRPLQDLRDTDVVYLAARFEAFPDGSRSVPASGFPRFYSEPWTPQTQYRASVSHTVWKCGSIQVAFVIPAVEYIGHISQKETFHAEDRFWFPSNSNPNVETVENDHPYFYDTVSDGFLARVWRAGIPPRNRSSRSRNSSTAPILYCRI